VGVQRRIEANVRAGRERRERERKARHRRQVLVARRLPPVLDERDVGARDRGLPAAHGRASASGRTTAVNASKPCPTSAAATGSGSGATASTEPPPPEPVSLAPRAPAARAVAHACSIAGVETSSVASQV